MGQADRQDDDAGPSGTAARFTALDDATPEELAHVMQAAEAFRAGLADRVLAELDRLRESFPEHAIDRRAHCIQTATRAYRDDRCEEYVVAALLHDVGDMLGTNNHPDVAAAILRPYVCRHIAWMVEKHGVFQQYHWVHKMGRDRDARDRYADHPAFGMTAEFCAIYDQNSFDPNYDNLPIATFEPMVRRIFARKPWGPHTEQDNPIDPDPARLRAGV